MRGLPRCDWDIGTYIGIDGAGGQWHGHDNGAACRLLGDLMRIFLFMAFVVVPVIEIALFLQVGSLIGIPATIGLVLLTALAGTMLVRSQGLDAINKVRISASRGEPPVEALIQGACVLVAGVLLLTPGFATDALGFALLIPPVRSLITGHIWKYIQPHIIFTSSQAQSGPYHNRQDHDGSRDSTIIEGHAVEIDNETDHPARTDHNRR